MRFPQDCLAATLYVVASLLISQSNNIGDKFLGAVCVIGPSWAGAVAAGIAVRQFSSSVTLNYILSLLLGVAITDDLSPRQSMLHVFPHCYQMLEQCASQDARIMWAGDHRKGYWRA